MFFNAQLRALLECRVNKLNRSANEMSESFPEKRSLKFYQNAIFSCCKNQCVNARTIRFLIVRSVCNPFAIDIMFSEN